MGMSVKDAAYGPAFFGEDAQQRLSLGGVGPAVKSAGTAGPQTNTGQSRRRKSGPTQFQPGTWSKQECQYFPVHKCGREAAVSAMHSTRFNPFSFEIASLKIPRYYFAGKKWHKSISLKRWRSSAA